LHGELENRTQPPRGKQEEQAADQPEGLWNFFPFFPQQRLPTAMISAEVYLLAQVNARLQLKIH
jgi:hypothetical protein